jgi:hypothetical protein
MFVTCGVCEAQIDLQCNGRDMHSIYLVNDTAFFRIDSVDTNPTDPIMIATNTITGGFQDDGISINNNLDTNTGQETMYYINGTGTYFFWNGTSWTNTNHTSVGVNPGGSTNYIYNIQDAGGQIYRYDGSSNAILLSSNPGILIWDVATDNQDNFYLFYTDSQKIIAFNSSGIPIDSFTTSGFPFGTDCSLTILGNSIYATTCNTLYGLYKGDKSGNMINFTLIKSLSMAFEDIASCSTAALPLAIFKHPEPAHFSVYPNPFSDKLNITTKTNDPLEITLFDITSRKLLHQQFTNTLTLNTSHLSKGIYIYELRPVPFSSGNKNAVIKKGKVVKD